jgi:cytochrome c556
MNFALKALTLVLPGLVCASVALAQLASVADAVKERQKEFKATGAAFKAVKDGLQAGNLDPEKAKDAASRFQHTAADISNWFPGGSGAEAGTKTAARPEIWSDRQGFSRASEQFADQAQKFAALAAAGTVNADSVKALGQTCSGCHDKYRVKQE